MAFTIKVNGKTHSVDVDGDTPLLWVLRDVLGMTGTKFGCGMALCGACTVHVDGVATRSCITPIDSIGTSADHDDRGDRRDAGGRQDPEGLARPRGRSMRLLPVGPDHVRFGAAREQPASDRCRYRRRDVRQHLPLRDLCPHSRSDQAGRAIELTGRLTMILDHLMSPKPPAGSIGIASVSSRRGFLQAGAAAGGGLMLSLSLPFASGEAEAADADGFAPNAFIRIATRRADRPDHALCRDGPGHLHVDPDADRRRAGGGSRSRCGWSTLRPTKSSTPIRCWACRPPATRTRYAAAWQPLRQAGATAQNHAGGGGGQALERRSGVLPRAKRRSAASADGKTLQIWRACRRCGPHAGPRQAWRSRSRRISS